MAKSTKKATDDFTPEERAAMRERARELKSAGKKAEGESDLLAKIEELAEPSRSMAANLHRIIKASAPELAPKTWYGMPAYANADGKVVCFFRPAEKFKERYLTLGFNESAMLDRGNMWPTSFAIVELTSEEEAIISELVTRSVSGC